MPILLFIYLTSVSQNRRKGDILLFSSGNARDWTSIEEAAPAGRDQFLAGARPSKAGRYGALQKQRELVIQAETVCVWRFIQGVKYCLAQRETHEDLEVHT